MSHFPSVRLTGSCCLFCAQIPPLSFFTSSRFHLNLFKKCMIASKNQEKEEYLGPLSLYCTLHLFTSQGFPYSIINYIYSSSRVRFFFLIVTYLVIRHFHATKRMMDMKIRGITRIVTIRPLNAISKVMKGFKLLYKVLCLIMNRLYDFGKMTKFSDSTLLIHEREKKLLRISR